MTDLHEKAEQLQGPDIVTTSDLPERPPGRPDSLELVDANDLSAEGTFPEFGEFLPVEEEGKEEESYWECPSNLAAVMVSRAEESGNALTEIWFDIVAAQKDPSGEWKFVTDIGTDDDS